MYVVQRFARLGCGIGRVRFFIYTSRSTPGRTSSATYAICASFMGQLSAWSMTSVKQPLPLYSMATCKAPSAQPTQEVRCRYRERCGEARAYPDLVPDDVRIDELDDVGVLGGLHDQYLRNEQLRNTYHTRLWGKARMLDRGNDGDDGVRPPWTRR